MLTTLLASIAVAASLADGPPPPITVSLNSGGQYNRGDYAQAQFRASADGYVLLLQTDQNGRIRVLFPLDPGDDNFIRGGKTYKVVGRDNRGSFYLDEAGASGMVYAAWSKSPFQFTEFVRGDHWDYSVFDQYNAADDPESQLTDFVLNFTTQGFDYAIDRYIVYSYSEVVTGGGGGTYIGVTGWPWPTYYTGGWSVGISFGSPCCYSGWYGYPAYGWGYPAYGWGYPAYGWGYPAYGWGYPAYGYGYPAYGYPGYGYGYPGYGPGYPAYRPYTFKPGGTITTAGNPYRPRGDAFAPRSSVFQTTYRDRPTYGMSGTGRLTTDAATISGRAEAGRRPAARPSAQPNPSGQRGSTIGRSLGGTNRGATGGTARRPSSGSGSGAAATPNTGGTRRPTTGTSGAAPRARSSTGASSNSTRARGWTSDGQERPAVSGRPRISPTAPSSGRSTAGSAGRTTAGSAASPRNSGRAATPSRQPSASGGSRPSVQPPSRSSGGSRPSAQPQSRPSSPPAARSGGRSGGGGAARGSAPSGGGGGGRRGR